MAEPVAFNFELIEVIEALVRKQGLTNGRWTVGFEFGFGAALAGPSPEVQRPTAFVQINKLTLIPADAQTPSHMVFDFSANTEQKPKIKSARTRQRKML